MAAGDYTQYRRWYADKTADVDLATGDGGKANVITCRSANHQLFIQKISYLPITSAAQAITFQDTANTPVKIGVVPASQTSPIILDYGPAGRALTAGKNFSLANTAGPAAAVHIEAYEKLTANIDLTTLSTAN
jgi:hypothetical protein